MTPNTPEPPDFAQPSRLSRRAVLKLASVSVVGGAFGAGSAALATWFHATTPQPYRYLSSPDAALLTDICEQLIPRDDAPGATDVGVIHFIDRQLASALSRHQLDYRRGLESFRQTCLAEFKRPFAQLAVHEKIELLRRVESAHVPRELWDKPTAPQFFRLVLSHTMQGFYGAPRHGGNHGYASYRMLGIDYPQIIGRNRYRRD